EQERLAVAREEHELRERQLNALWDRVSEIREESDERLELLRNETAAACAELRSAREAALADVYRWVYEFTGRDLRAVP
ncbi:MAG: hypothetical protein KC636_39040, partial [Myxococcales bacterium]|nr:hypothetical protein [Myxococcales bacterium]